MLSPTAVPVLATVAFIAALAVCAAIAVLLLRPETDPRHTLTLPPMPTEPELPPMPLPLPAPAPVTALCPLDPGWDWQAAAALLEDTELVAA